MAFKVDANGQVKLRALIHTKDEEGKITSTKKGKVYAAWPVDAREHVAVGSAEYVAEAVPEIVGGAADKPGGALSPKQQKTADEGIDNDPPEPYDFTAHKFQELLPFASAAGIAEPEKYSKKDLCAELARLGFRPDNKKG